MTDQISDQISAFIDNELSEDESALLVRRFERDPDARSRAFRYTLIGSALRGELLEPHPSVLRQRVAAALSGATPNVVKPRERWAARLAAPALRVGIAAAVAVVAINALRMLNDSSTASPPLAGGLQAGTPPAIYVVPQEVAENRLMTQPITLTNYMMHHGVYASGLTRTSVNSNVVGGAAELPVTETAVGKPQPVDLEDQPEKP